MVFAIPIQIIISMSKTSRMPICRIAAFAEIDLAELRKLNMAVPATMIPVICLLTIELIDLFALLAIERERANLGDYPAFILGNFRSKHIAVFLCQLCPKPRNRLDFVAACRLCRIRLNGMIYRPDQALGINPVQFFAVPMVNLRYILFAILPSDREVDPRIREIL